MESRPASAAMDSQKSYLKTLGKRILSEANDLKRTPEALADELGYELTVVQSVIDGDATVNVARSLLGHMCDVYPISLANLWVEPDDTVNGVIVVRADASRDTSRKISRIDRAGNQTIYYEYRDTAMSKTAAFKPEWIQPIRIVHDLDAENPDVVYNNGHLMHQCTFFIGEVNFYWEVAGAKHCAELNTGDSNYITPFVPHSFTSRNPDKLGLIIAVTFGGSVRSALNEFSQIGSSGIEAMADDLQSASHAFTTRLNRCLNGESLSVAAFLESLTQAGMDWNTASEIVNGAKAPTPAQLQTISDTLHVRLEDLIVTAMDPEEAVVVNFGHKTSSRPYPNSNQPAYQLKELARTRHQPGLCGLDITVLETPDGNGGDNAWFRHHLHEYIYNYGDNPVQIIWDKTRKDVLAPGDSAYIRPMIEHRLACRDGDGPGHLAVLRISGTVNDASINEFSRFPADRRNRAIEETGGWF